MSKALSNGWNSGYTMMELIMVIALVAILGTIAIPGFKYVTTSNRIATEVNGLLGDMQFARSEAIKQGQTVTVCISNVGGTGCAGNAAGGTWQLGWIVFLDTNHNQQVDNGEAVIRVQPPFTGTDTFVGPVNFNSLTFNRLGYAPTGQTATINVRLHDSTNTAAWTRCLAVSPIGGVTTERQGVSIPPAPVCT